MFISFHRKKRTHFIESQTFAILDERNFILVRFTENSTPLALLLKMFDYGGIGTSANIHLAWIAMQFEIYHFKSYLQLT